MAATIHTGIRRLPRAAAVALTLALMGGCQHQAANPPAGEPAAGREAVQKPAEDEGPVEPAEVELSDAQGRIEGGIFHFEVKYRFTKGRPSQHYLVTVNFPGTKNLCLKHMEAWELKTEGAIKDGYELIEQPVTAYEITFSEASSPQYPYKKISNTLAGTLPTPGGDAAPPEK